MTYMSVPITSPRIGDGPGWFDDHTPADEARWAEQERIEEACTCEDPDAAPDRECEIHGDPQLREDGLA